MGFLDRRGDFRSLIKDALSASGDGPYAFAIEAPRLPGHQLRLLFTPGMAQVLGQVWIPRGEWSTPRSITISSGLDLLGFESAMSGLGQGFTVLPEATLPESWQWPVEDLALFARAALPTDPADLAGLIDDLATVVFGPDSQPRILNLATPITAPPGIAPPAPMAQPDAPASEAEPPGAAPPLAAAAPPARARTTARKAVARRRPAASKAAAGSRPAARKAATRGARAVKKAAVRRAQKPAAPRSPDPPRKFFAHLRAPDVVVAGHAFALGVGISGRSQAGVVGERLSRPASSVGDYTLTMQLVAGGFALADGESWRHDVRVTATKPYPKVTLHLTAEKQRARVRARAIQAIYSVGSQTIGLAVRPLAVVRSASLVAAAPAVKPRTRVNIAVPAGQKAPDLTARIVFDGAQSQGRLAWTFETSVGLATPPTPEFSDVDNQPQEFARQLIDRINALEGQPGLFEELKGTGRQIAQKIPHSFWQLLQAVARKTAPKPPTVLILSREPYIPWELAVMPDPLVAPKAAPFLAAQAAVGRWVLNDHPPPKPTPLPSLRIIAAAVISGKYGQVPGWRALPEAEAEASRIGALYGAAPVNAEVATVLECLRGFPRAELLHFAVHGQYDPTGTEDGLMMVDGHTLSPEQVMGSDLKVPALVFLNACQVGSGNKLLGNYAGMAAAFLNAGAAAVVAPLWSVDDATARAIALRFYRQVARGKSPAEALRIERAKFLGGKTPSATYLAYQFFGHPAMAISLTPRSRARAAK